jgi:hypothetical protein
MALPQRALLGAQATVFTFLKPVQDFGANIRHACLITSTDSLRAVAQILSFSFDAIQFTYMRRRKIYRQRLGTVVSFLPSYRLQDSE